MTSPLRRFVVGGAIALILAAACSTSATTSGADDDTSDPITTGAEPITTGTTEPFEMTDDLAEEVFTTAMAMDGVFLDVPDPTLIEIGWRICQDFDDGVTFTELGVQVAANPTLRNRADEVGYIIGAAVTSLCPEHADKVPGL